MHKIRQMSSFAFIILRTGRYLMQAIYDPSVCAEKMDGIREGNFVSVTGVVKENEKAVGGLELQLKVREVIK